MTTEKQIGRWAKDWAAVKDVITKKVDSVQFAAPAGRSGSERAIVRFQDGTRLIFEAQPDSTIRAWLSCCGKPDGDPPPA